MRRGSGIATGQRGSVLIISLIILLVLTMLGIAAIRLGITNLLATNNMQARQEAQAAAEEVINKQVLSINFLSNFNIDAALQALADTPYTYNAGSATYTVRLTKPCVRSMQYIPGTESPLSEALAEVVAPGAKSYKQCLSGVDEFGSPQSTCYRAVWEVQATAVDNSIFGARTVITQGFQIIMGMQNTVNVTNQNFFCAPM